jgi:tetratricopeptide (TPR) repeat protein
LDEQRAERAAELFEEALGLPPDGRARFLDELASREPVAYEDLTPLLASHSASPDYLDGLGAVLERAFRGLGGVGVDDPPEVVAGESVGRYRVLEKLGAGGMGVVYRAIDPTLNRPVALKFLSPDLGADSRARARLIAEARAASALDHPNIAVVYEIGALRPREGDTGDGRLFIAMACYEGQTLRQGLAAGPLPLAEALSYGRQLAAGLARAHEAGIVHRDVKPANLMITERGLVKIVDFGIAKLAEREATREDVTPGTIAYMSPEQTRSEPVDARTDVWSAGVVLYEMVAGRRPFTGEDDAVLIQAIRHDPAPRLGAVRTEVPATLESVIDRCLQKDADARYPDAGALQAALEAVSEGSAAGRIAGRPRRIVLAGVVATAAALVALVLLPVSPPSAEVRAAASNVLVLPLVSPANDTALVRLGRDLAITLSATLDGLGDIRTVDAPTVLAQLAVRGSVPPTATEGRTLARRLGARTVLAGSLVRAGPTVRADVRLIGVRESEALARATAIAAEDSLGALTDSLALHLVRQLLRVGDVPVPSLDAVTTRSVAALRAYVDGEQALAAGDMALAVNAFERAFEADSTFWFAYWRSLYPRVYEGSLADSAVLAEVIRRRDELPERDRLLIEAGLESTVTSKAAALRALIDRYPTYWPAAWSLANLHVHWTPHVGRPLADARAGLERVVALNPRFAPGWHHLFWITAFQGDAARARTALETLERLVDPAELRWELTLGDFRTGLEALESGGDVSPEREAEVTDVIRRVTAQVPGLSAGLAGGFIPYGFTEFQIRLNRRLLASRPVQSHAADLRMGITMAWATRGAWDSVAVELDGWMRASTDPRDPLRGYGLGMLGVVLGGWGHARPESLRRAAVEAAAAGDADDRAELAWLDGILAYSVGDASALENARIRIQGSGATHAAVLDGSLEGFQQAVSGGEPAAARTLEQLELAAGDRRSTAAYAGRHPYLSAVNRLSAGRWLLSAGDTTAAARLLEWYHGVPGTSQSFRDVFATFAVLPFVHMEQARIAEARGRMEEAAGYYGQIVRRYDLPSSPGGVRLVEQAEAALAGVDQ